MTPPPQPRNVPLISEMGDLYATVNDKVPELPGHRQCNNLADDDAGTKFIKVYRAESWGRVHGIG